MPYVGSSGIEVSTANQELVVTPVDWVNTKMFYSQFSFLNEDPCTVCINGSDPIYLRAFQGWNVEANKNNNLQPVKSFKIVEQNVKFNLAAGY